MTTIERRLLLWTVICSISAAPSFFLAAAADYHKGAMVAGVVLFIAAYTAITSTALFEAFHRLPFVRRTLYIGYGARLLLSIAYPIGWFVDLFPGLVSISAIKELGFEEESFVGTLLTTIIQGTLLNIIIGVFMLVVWGFQWLIMKPPEQSGPRGFEVMPVPTANVTTPSPAAVPTTPREDIT